MGITIQDEPLKNEEISNLAQELTEIPRKKLGLSEEQWKEFCFTDEYSLPSLPDQSRMIEELHNIHDSDGGNKKIAVYSHDDADGIMSEIIAVAGLTDLGFDVTYFFSDITSHYKVTHKDLNDFLDENAAAVLICDRNITGKDSIDYKYARDNNLKLIVVDHHIPGDMESDAYDNMIYVNPYRDDLPVNEKFPEKYRDLCSACIMWMILHAYAQKYDREKLAQIDHLQVFAGIATIADYIELSYISRRVVINSKEICRDLVYGCGTADAVKQIDGSVEYKQAFQGLFYLIRSTEAEGNIFSKEDINELYYKNVLSSLLNTPKDAISVDCSNAQGKNEICDAKTMDDYIYSGLFFADNPPFENIENIKERHEEINKIIEKAFNELKSFEGSEYIWLTTPNYAFCIGRLAQRKRSELGKPAIVIYKSKDESSEGCEIFKGSLRSSKKTPLAELINKSRELNGIISCDGHGGAASVVLYASKDNTLRADECHTISEKISDFTVDSCEIDSNADIVISYPDDQKGGLYYYIDGEEHHLCDFDHAGAVLLYYAKMLPQDAPFGVGFNSPAIEIEFTKTDIKATDSFGKNGSPHLKIKLNLPINELPQNLNYADNNESMFSLQLEIICYNQANFFKKFPNDTHFILKNGEILINTTSGMNAEQSLQISGILERT